MTGSSTMVAMCAGPESGVSSTVARDINASSCGSVSLATWFTSGARELGDGRRHVTLLVAGPAAQDDAHAVFPGRVVRHGGIPFRQPVAQSMTRAGADQQRAVSPAAGLRH